jgi:hypothetical protein
MAEFVYDISSGSSVYFRYNGLKLRDNDST